MDYKQLLRYFLAGKTRLLPPPGSNRFAFPPQNYEKNHLQLLLSCLFRKEGTMLLTKKRHHVLPAI